MRAPSRSGGTSRGSRAGIRRSAPCRADAKNSTSPEGDLEPPSRASRSWYRAPAPMRRNAVTALLFALFCACGERAPEGAAALAPRLLVVGWDGASFRAIDPLLAAGKLPHLAELVARGSRAVLESTIVPISSAAWTTATTGKGPGEHGVFGFHEPEPGSYSLRLASA